MADQPEILPLAQIRVKQNAILSSRGEDEIHVLLDGKPIARLAPLAVSYEMVWERGLPIVECRFIGGRGEFETRPPTKKEREGGRGGQLGT